MADLIVIRRAGVSALVLAISALGVPAQVTHARQKTSVAELKTTAEASGYKSTSTYDDVVRFMKAVDEASPLVFYATYGTTHEGRAMPMAVVGTPLTDASAASVKASGRLRVHIQANVHAGEVEGKEAALQPAPPAPRAWATFEHVPRFHNNYVGLRNRFALLSEAYAYATFEDRIKATNYFMEEALNFAHENAPRLKKAIADADRERIVGAMQATSAKLKRGGMVEILMGEVENETNPINGAVMNRRKEVSTPEPMVDMLWFEPSATETVPSAYYIPADATQAMALLKTHGVQMKAVTQPVQGVEQFTISTSIASPAAFEGHMMRKLEGKWNAAPGVTVPRGAWEVSLAQPLARLAFYLLEPVSDDGLVNWNVLDEQLKDAKTYPVLRRK